MLELTNGSRCTYRQSQSRVSEVPFTRFPSSVLTSVAPCVPVTSQATPQVLRLTRLGAVDVTYAEPTRELSAGPTPEDSSI